MTTKMTAESATRREAEMAVEHLVQEYKLDRNAVMVTTAVCREDRRHRAREW